MKPRLLYWIPTVHLSYFAWRRRERAASSPLAALAT